MKPLIILQARIKSGRLYGKVIKKINNIPLVVLCAKRLNNSNIPLIVAIPKTRENLILKKILKNNKLKFFCGSHLNIFDRYFNIIKDLDDNTIVVRATSDNPLPDGLFVNEMIKFFVKKNLDYLDTTKKNFILPHGLAIQIFKAKLLKRVKQKKLSKFDKEHVSTSISNMKNIKVYKKKYTKYKSIFSKEKFSVDTLKDFKKIVEVFSLTKRSFSEKFFILIRKYNESKKI